VLTRLVTDELRNGAVKKHYICGESSL